MNTSGIILATLLLLCRYQLHAETMCSHGCQAWDERLQVCIGAPSESYCQPAVTLAHRTIQPLEVTWPRTLSKKELIADIEQQLHALSFRSIGPGKHQRITPQGELASQQYVLGALKKIAQKSNRSSFSPTCRSHLETILFNHWYAMNYGLGHTAEQCKQMIKDYLRSQSPSNRKHIAGQAQKLFDHAFIFPQHPVTPQDTLAGAQSIAALEQAQQSATQKLTAAFSKAAQCYWHAITGHPTHYKTLAAHRTILTQSANRLRSQGVNVTQLVSDARTAALKALRGTRR